MSIMSSGELPKWEIDTSELKGDFSKIPHDLIYALPPKEEDLGPMTHMSNEEAEILKKHGIDVNMYKTARQFTMSSSIGEEFTCGVLVGSEFNARYAVDFRPMESVYVGDSFRNRAAFTVTDDLYWSAGPVSPLLKLGLISPGEVKKVPIFNIVSKIPEMRDGEVVRDKRRGGAITYSDQRHPLIRSSEFIKWGIEHLDKMPKEVRKQYGMPKGIVTGVLLTWDKDSDNYWAFIEKYKGKDKNIVKAAKSTYSVNLMREIGFGNIRYISIDNIDPVRSTPGRLVRTENPVQVSMFIARSDIQGDINYLRDFEIQGRL